MYYPGNWIHSFPWNLQWSKIIKAIGVKGE